MEKQIENDIKTENQTQNETQDSVPQSSQKRVRNYRKNDSRVRN